MSESLRYKGYRAEIAVDAAERAFHGKVADVRDVVHFQGSSFDELEAAFHESVDDYLDWCAELGQEPEKPYSGRLLLRMTPSLHRALAKLADRKGMSINSLIVDALETAVSKTRGQAERVEL